MRNFVTYDKSSSNIICDTNKNIPLYCKKCINDKSKKCQNYYKNLLNENKKGIHTCPYGFSSYYIRNNIYTSIVIPNSKVVKNIESQKQKLKDFDIYNVEQLENIIHDYEKEKIDNIELRDCMHDLRNIGGYFNSMTETLEMKYNELIENDENIKALLSLYDLVNYRLNVFYGVNDVDDKKIKAKLYPLFKKLKVMMRYQATKKKINIKLDFEQENLLQLSNNIYLAMFILLENAIKHSLSNNEISVDFEETNRYTIVSISNVSVVIDEDEKEMLFERGYRGKNCISKGTGIGLSLVKKILENHGYEYNVNIDKITNDKCRFKISIKFPCAD